MHYGYVPPPHTKQDQEDLEIRTISVKKALEPLILQVTTLVNTKGPSKKKKGRSKRAHVLVAAIEKATENFIERGKQIAYENPDIEHANMLGTVEEVRKTGTEMSFAAREFADDPCSSLKRQHMVQAARNFLSTVTKLLILADKVDVQLLLGNRVRVLNEAGNHIFNDVNKCIHSLQDGSANTLNRTAVAIRSRAACICDVVTAEMYTYEPGTYTDRVLEAVKVLRDQVMPNFAQRVQIAVDALSSNPPKDVDENEFVEAATLVYDGVYEIRRAVLTNTTYDEASAHDTDHEIDEYPDISGITTARDAMCKMTEEDKQKIAQQVEHFRNEKLKFDREIAKWDDAGNDIIELAKHMCQIMMEMTDFTRGRGPLKTTMDVINAAKKISEAGINLDKLSRQIADQCPESATKKDLHAYLQRIALYCHQLNITSKVKADVQNISGELIVSGLDSAMSLIQAAKNLMNAVVLTVKASYVARIHRN